MKDRLYRTVIIIVLIINTFFLVACDDKTEATAGQSDDSTISGEKAVAIAATTLPAELVIQSEIEVTYFDPPGQEDVEGSAEAVGMIGDNGTWLIIFRGVEIDRESLAWEEGPYIKLPPSGSIKAALVYIEADTGEIRYRIASGIDVKLGPAPDSVKVNVPQ